MGKGTSHWVMGLLCIDPDDARVWVPLPCKLGLALNFGNPRVVPTLGWVSVTLLGGLFVVPIAAHATATAGNPSTPLLWLLAWVAAFAAILPNPCFRWLDYREMPLASYGLVAVSVGLGLQNLVLGPLVLWGGGVVNLSWAHGLIGGPVCALAQTLGKWAAIVLLLKVRPAPTRYDQARYGLLVGLGFTVYEIAILYTPVAWATAALGFLSVWERTSVSVFHVYSAGLVALALWSKRPWLVGLVVVLHSLMDGLAIATRPLHLSFTTVEVVVSALAALTWGAFVLAVWPRRNA